MTNRYAPTQSNYQFQEEDGTEATATLLGTINTPLTRSVVTDSNIQLRIRVDETGSGSINGAAGATFQLQRDIAGGGFADVTSTSTGAKANTSSQVVDGSASTARLGGIAGQQDDQNGAVTFTHAADTNPEHVFGLTLIAADLADGNALTFRLLYNGTQFSAMTQGAYTVVPTLNITKALNFTGVPGAAALTATGQAPTTAAASTLEPGLAALVATGQAPTWSGIMPDFTGEPANGTLTATGLAPTVEAAAVLEPGIAALVATGLAPTVSVGLTERLTPNAVVAGGSNLRDSATNSPPTVLTDIDDETGSPDPSWWTAVNPEGDIDIRVGFPTSSGNLVGTQTMRVLIRGTSLPSRDVTLELWENGAPSPGTPAVTVTEAVNSIVGQVVTLTFNPSTDLVDQTGAGVELRIRATAA